MGGGIRSLLSPLTNMITQQLAKQSQESFNDKIDPYIDQVETLTTDTFPELDMSSTGGGIGNFPSPSINAPLFQPFNPTGIQPYRAFGVPADSPLHKNDLSTFVDFGNQMNQKGKNSSYQATPSFLSASKVNNILDQGMQALYGYK